MQCTCSLSLLGDILSIDGDGDVEAGPQRVARGDAAEPEVRPLPAVVVLQLPLQLAPRRRQRGARRGERASVEETKAVISTIFVKRLRYIGRKQLSTSH